jgi:hypothetical protein
VFAAPVWAAPPKPHAPLRILRQSRSCKAAVMGDFIVVDFLSDSSGGQILSEANA